MTDVMSLKATLNMQQLKGDEEEHTQQSFNLGQGIDQVSGSDTYR